MPDNIEIINPNPVKTLPFENISFLFFSLSSPQRKTAVKIFNDTTGNNIFTVVLIKSETPNAEADNILVYIGTIKKDISKRLDAHISACTRVCKVASVMSNSLRPHGL